MLLVEVSSSPSGSAKPREVAAALGVASSGDLHAPVARMARLGFGGEAFETVNTEINADAAVKVFTSATSSAEGTPSEGTAC
jgi:hypothetical protein